MVKDGDTAVGGGLLWEEKQTDKRKVPILGDIPLIGNLFRSKGDTKSKKELIIFITPHVVQWDETAEAQGNEPLNPVVNSEEVR
jgi:type II secretory pathway component GspD/PulD (secretin)